MIYKYSGIDAKGKKISSKLEANSLNEAKQKLHAQKIIYKTLKEESISFSKFTFKLRYKIKASELANLSRDFSLYLSSGISLIKAVELSLNQYGANKHIKLFLQSVKTSLDEGQNFYHALESQKIITLPNFYLQSIKVSEDSGILDKVLGELAIFLKNQDRINKQLQGAFAYPLFILVVSVLMVGFMISYVVPKITSIFAQLNQSLPTSTKFVIFLGDLLSKHWLVCLLGFVGFIICFKLAMKFNARFKYIIDSLMLKLPFFGKLIQNTELGRFTYISSILLSSGVPFVQNVNLASKILKNSVISEAFIHSSNKVVEGSKFSVALLKGKYKPPASFIQAIALGEETSQVGPILNNLSEMYFQENKDKLDVFLSMLEPALMLIVGGLIGFIVTAMLLPIFSINIQ